MKNWIVISGLLLKIACSCHAADLAEKLLTDPALVQLREGLISSFQANDMDRFVTYLDTNVVVTWQSGEVCEGREAVKGSYEKLTQGDRPMFQKIVVDPKIVGHQLRGDWVVVWGEMNDQLSFRNKSSLPFRSRFTVTAHRLNDRWSVASMHLSANVFENPMLTLATRRVATFGGVLAGLLGLGVGFSFGKSWKARHSAP